MQIARVVASEPGAVMDAFTAFFPGALIGADGDDEFRFRLAAYTAGPMSLLEYEMSGPTIRATGSSSGFTVCDVRLVGEMSHGRTPIDTALPFVYPDQLTATRVRSTSRLIDVDADAVRAYATQFTGDEGFRLHMTGSSVLSAHHARMWRSVAALAAGLIRLGTADNAVIAASVGDLVMSAFLTTFPTNALDRPDRPELCTAVTRGVRRARAFMDEHYGEPVGLAEVAAASGLSIRGLQHAFRRDLGTTPTGYLRRVRLDAARRELLAADPTSGDVAGIARAAGFAHLSRFAAAYRREFDELPSRTLAR